MPVVGVVVGFVSSLSLVSSFVESPPLLTESLALSSVLTGGIEMITFLFESSASLPVVGVGDGVLGVSLPEVTGFKISFSKSSSKSDTSASTFGFGSGVM